MMKRKLKSILHNSVESQRSKTLGKKITLSRYGISNLSTSFTKSRSISVPPENQLTQINENYKDHLISFGDTERSIRSKSRNRTTFLNSSLNSSKGMTNRFLKDVPRVIYSQLEDNIEKTLIKLGHKEKGSKQMVLLLSQNALKICKLPR